MRKHTAFEAPASSPDCKDLMMLLLIDNYDSFTYNLVHYFEKMDVEVEVVRNDQNIPSLQAFDALVLSPGPGLPKESGKLMDVIANAYGKKPILGICLGMQALAEHAGAKLYNRDGRFSRHRVQHS